MEGEPLMNRQSHRTPPASSSSRRLIGYSATFVALAALVMSLTPLAAGAEKRRAAAPSAATNVAVRSADLTSITLSWTAPKVATRLLGYDVYTNGVRLRSGIRATTTSSLSYTVTGLRCGTSYLLGVAAVVSGGARSAIVSVIASTSPCSDSVPPSAPTGMNQVAATTMSATVSWVRSTDNFGVTGYGAFKSGVPIGITAGASYTFAGLLCGSSYAVALGVMETELEANGLDTVWALESSLLPCVVGMEATGIHVEREKLRKIADEALKLAQVAADNLRTALGNPTVEPVTETYHTAPDTTQDDHLDELPFGTRGGAVVPDA